MALLELRKEERKNKLGKVDVVVLTAIYLRPIEKRDPQIVAHELLKQIQDYPLDTNIFIISQDINTGVISDKITATDAHDFTKVIPNLLKRINRIWVVDADDSFYLLAKVFSLYFRRIYFVDTPEEAHEQLEKEIQEIRSSNK